MFWITRLEGQNQQMGFPFPSFLRMYEKIIIISHNKAFMLTWRGFDLCKTTNKCLNWDMETQLLYIKMESRLMCGCGLFRETESMAGFTLPGSNDPILTHSFFSSHVEQIRYVTWMLKQAKVHELWYYLIRFKPPLYVKIHLIWIKYLPVPF